YRRADLGRHLVQVAGAVPGGAEEGGRLGAAVPGQGDLDLGGHAERRGHGVDRGNDGPDVDGVGVVRQRRRKAGGGGGVVGGHLAGVGLLADAAAAAGDDALAEVEGAFDVDVAVLEPDLAVAVGVAGLLDRVVGQRRDPDGLAGNDLRVGAARVVAARR